MGRGAGRLTCAYTRLELFWSRIEGVVAGAEPHGCHSLVSRRGCGGCGSGAAQSWLLSITPRPRRPGGCGTNDGVWGGAEDARMGDSSVLDVGASAVGMAKLTGYTRHRVRLLLVGGAYAGIDVGRRRRNGHGRCGSP
ncbi:hypothetical protein Zm00014a_011555 [Zea mays]|uniref:Uncharacterized protein n=1 Tax=Zea mays TaxID=4577 RepID=A0A3L6FEW7_MAIZE|nr:hypothetical protein Zm00014a_011555 [Zea mays]